MIFCSMLLEEGRIFSLYKKVSCSRNLDLHANKTRAEEHKTKVTFALNKIKNTLPEKIRRCVL